jgi:hypothetical protein
MWDQQMRLPHVPVFGAWENAQSASVFPDCLLAVR